MSDMYRKEVPAYGTLQMLVAEINEESLESVPDAKALIEASGGIARLSAERHGAIRVGTAEELRWIRRVFALMGMYPVGYYDLSLAGLPVHSTAFRPVEPAALAVSSFRIFCSLLRLELIEDEGLRKRAADILSARQIFSDIAMQMIEEAEEAGGVREDRRDVFLSAVLDTFKWQSRASVDAATYEAFVDTHKLVADIVCFKGPHINHLTPRTLDIDAVQTAMPAHAIDAKAVIEGPPRRACPILLRQTSFKALSEPVSFPDANGRLVEGVHTARFGEIEQRGVALTPKGRALYDRLLDRVRETVTPRPDGSNATEYCRILSTAFETFPDDWHTLRREGLAYFHYEVRDHRNGDDAESMDALIMSGKIVAHPVTYEDFLPISAAGIFQSNLGNGINAQVQARAMQAEFETALGVSVTDPFDLYETIQSDSLRQCREAVFGEKA